MAEVKLIATGLRTLIKDMEGYLDELNKNVGIEMTNAGEDVERYAKWNHRFISRSNNLEESVYAEYKIPSQGVHTMEFGLKDVATTVPDGRSYGVFIHEGTYQGYSQSPIAPLYSNSISKSGNGWKADPFLWNAIGKRWDIEDGLRKMSNRIKRKYERV